MLEPGTPAPDFEATLDDGGRFRLSEYRGRKHVVLYFYPRDFSGGCTHQACSFRDSYAAVGAYDAIIVGVSGDSLESHQRFKQEHALNFPIVSDEDGSLREKYDVRTRIPLLRPRVTYVIDKQGVIRAAFRHDVAIGRHLSDTLAALAQLQGSAAV